MKCMSFVCICDEVAVMESGKVIEQGPVTQVFENANMYDKTICERRFK